MVFPSLPLYLDPPTWNQEQAVQPQQREHQQQHLQPVPTQPPPDGNTGGGGPSASIRPNSMADRARLAKIPQPEQALKCPRCDSTNTKFCYFNNYSLSQPRHFCKTCRRYWTHGGALRSVPVGGGCRRNKRSKNTSKAASSDSTMDRQAGASSSSTAMSAGTSSLAVPQPQLPFMTSLQPMMEYSGGGVPNLGLGFSGMQEMDHSAGVDYNQIQLQQFQFLGGLETQLPTMPVLGMYHFDGEPTGSELVTQMASVKMEDSNLRRLNLGRQHFSNLGVGINSRNDRFWGGGGGDGGGNNGGEGSSAAAGGGDGRGGGAWVHGESFGV